jgi:hypothetical protein
MAADTYSARTRRLYLPFNPKWHPSGQKKLPSKIGSLGDCRNIMYVPIILTDAYRVIIIIYSKFLTEFHQHVALTIYTCLEL